MALHGVGKLTHETPAATKYCLETDVQVKRIVSNSKDNIDRAYTATPGAAEVVIVVVKWLPISWQQSLFLTLDYYLHKRLELVRRFQSQMDAAKENAECKQIESSIESIFV